MIFNNVKLPISPQIFLLALSFILHEVCGPLFPHQKTIKKAYGFTVVLLFLPLFSVNKKSAYIMKYGVVRKISLRTSWMPQLVSMTAPP